MAKKQAKFEELLADLEKLVEQLEGGELSLDEALECYEKGVKTLRACRQLLDEAEKKVQMLVKDEAGNLTEQPFEPEPPDKQA